MEPGTQFDDLSPEDRRRLDNQTRCKEDPEYAKHYRRGRMSSMRYRGGMTSPLERADMRGEPDAWYDGYHDHANG